MWCLTIKKLTDQRPVLHMYDTQELAEASRVAFVAEFPDAEVSSVFEEDANYRNIYPHVMGLVTNSDGSVDLLWSDGVRTPMPV